MHRDSFILIYSTLLHIPQLNVNFSKRFSIVPRPYVYKKQDTEVNAVVFMLQEFQNSFYQQMHPLLNI
jgi:hypothetical protein